MKPQNFSFPASAITKDKLMFDNNLVETSNRETEQNSITTKPFECLLNLYIDFTSKTEFHEN
jgi:hypothetical protein